MRYLTLLLIAASSAFAQTPAEPPAQTPAAAPAAAQPPVLEVKSEVEDGKKMLIATVTRDGKPLPDVPVSFYVDRLFGRLLIGEDKTLEDGSAAVEAPEDLASGPSGELKIIVQAALPDTSPEETEASTEVAMRSAPEEPPASPAPTPPRIIDAAFTLKGEVRLLQEQGRNERTLWAPRAPIPLLATITVLLVVVWGSYAFVVGQIIKIKQGATKT